MVTGKMLTGHFLSCICCSVSILYVGFGWQAGVVFSCTDTPELPHAEN